jgi:protein TonB
MRRSRSFTPALLLSVILHALLLLGLGLTIALPRVRPDLTSTLDVVLLHRPSPQSSKRADYLSDANQAGAVPKQTEQPTPETPPPASAEKGQPPSPQPAREKPLPKPAGAVRPSPKHQPIKEKARPAPPAATPQEEPPPLPSAAQLINSGLKMASIDSAPDRAGALAHDHLPREKFVSARTREHKYAAYMDAWRIKVEAIGNLNYPEQARRQGLTGELVLDVALKPDGSVKYMTVLRSSGSTILDEAAVRIVRLAAPFAPFPEAIRSETDLLHIIRTWRFERGNRLASAR